MKPDIGQAIIMTPSSNLSSFETQSSVDQFHIAQGYFSDILQAQTAIFSLIVAGLIAFYVFFNWRTSKSQIKKEADAHFLEVKEQIEKEFIEKMENLQTLFATGMSQQKNEIGKLTGQNYRTLGEFWDSEKKYSTAFIWWFRGAHQFALVSSESLARVCLSSAKESIERVAFAFELDTDTIGEYQKLILEIPDTYKIEKEMLDSAFKATLLKKAP